MLNRLIQAVDWKLGFGLWVFMILASAGANLFWEYRQAESIARAQAMAIVDYIQVISDWNRAHQGIYLKRTEPAGRGARDTGGFISVNPYMMMAELSRIAEQDMRAQFRITSLKPLNQRNAPGQWEAEALKRFDTGEQAFGGFMDDDTRYGFMVPLYTTEECLQCHGHQGYRVGDVRGGISVVQNVALLKETRTTGVINIVLVHLLVLLLSVAIFKIYLGNLKRMQALEVKRQMAETANQFKTDFISTIGHELRTPLNAITGLTSSLQGAAFEDHQNDIALIRQAANKLEMIINQMVNLTKIDQDDYPVKLAAFSIEKLLNDIVSAHRPAAFKKGITIETAVAADVPARLELDQEILAGILNPLIDNAVKFSERGKITLECEIKERLAGKPRLMIRVIDDGRGFDKPPSWFEQNPFSQSEHYLSRSHGGLGLGLTLARKLLKLVNGRLEIETRKAQGSTVSIIVPVKKSADQAMRAHDELPLNAGSGNVSDGAVADVANLPVLDRTELLQLVELIKTLRQMLEGGDIGAVEILNQSQALFSYFGSEARRLSEQVENLEFEQALVSLNRIVGQLKQIQQALKNQSS